MLKLNLSLIATLILIAFKPLTAQIYDDSTQYVSRKLKVDEVNFVTGYYQQEGNNAAVTGGIGDEHLTDMATTFNLNFSKYDKHFHKHSIKAELGVDVYTSASSDKINPNTISSASSGDVRVYPSLNYSFLNDTKHYNLGGGISFSNEYDYQSFGSNLLFSKWSKDHNREFSAKASIFLDRWKVIYPYELRPPGYGTGGHDGRGYVDYSPRNSYNLGLVYSWIFNRNFQMTVLTDLTFQDGLLGTKFHRVYFNEGSVKPENVPSKRTKIPVGMRANYFLGDNVVLRGFYRYYWDDWDMKSQTASLEVSYKLSPFISLAPSYRYYAQTAANFFNVYKAHSISEVFYSSDYDLSKFDSSMIGLNARFSNLDKKFLVIQLQTLEVRYSYYKRSTGLDAHIVSLALTFK